MLRGRFGVLVGVVALMAGSAAPVSAEPGLSDGAVVPVESAAATVAASAPPADDGAIESAPAASSVAPDGWTLTVGANHELLKVVHPLTTALSSRDYEVSAVFNGSLRGPDGAAPPHGLLEVGYQIGCGIDMSTSQGVTISGSAGITPSIGLGGIETASPLPEFLNPIVLAPMTGGVAVGLKPGIVNIVPVVKKEFTGADPWVSVNGFHVKIDGCVGQSYIRSYAVLMHSTDQSESLQAYYGTTKQV